jgi:hypothetical protein
MTDRPNSQEIWGLGTLEHWAYCTDSHRAVLEFHSAVRPFVKMEASLTFRGKIHLTYVSAKGVGTIVAIVSVSFLSFEAYLCRLAKICLKRQEDLRCSGFVSGCVSSTPDVLRILLICLLPSERVGKRHGDRESAPGGPR